MDIIRNSVWLSQGTDLLAEGLYRVLDFDRKVDLLILFKIKSERTGFAPIFPDICYHLTHYKPAAADIPVASDNPAHYADAIRYNARTPLQGSLLPLTPSGLGMILM